MMKRSCTRFATVLAVFVILALTFRAQAQTSASTVSTDTDAGRIADLITASHVLANEGILDTFGHASVRSAKNPNHFYMPRAMPPALVSSADIVELDMDCRPVTPNAPRLNGERYIHCEIYKARPEVQSVIHTHDLAVIPFGLTGEPLRPVLVQAGFLPPETPLFEVRDAYGDAPVHAMLVTNATLGHALADKLGRNPAVLMRGHGDVVVGGSVKEATVRTIYTNIDARAQWAALQVSKKIISLDAAELAENARENFDADRPWENYKQRLLSHREH